MMTFPKTSNITEIIFNKFDTYDPEPLRGVKWDVQAGSYFCSYVYLAGAEPGSLLCLPPYAYYPWYIFTKGRLQI